ncbi:LuxR C-terminal-related transcriptional regulator [Gorillibacterium massiliense]|uniref:LuxR C-terminal-related transcriptional regulator n=1 Tax=Gorillibacterium massiliense TaxID=1280390 RepID=UPI0012DBE6E7|nr:LuxR C-terminal-related transcriptional regulator [Gorillibacterium massiliense]
MNATVSLSAGSLDGNIRLTDYEKTEGFNRSHSFGLSETETKLRYRIPGDMLQRLLIKHQNLLLAFRRQQVLHESIDDFSYLLILTDEKGIVLAISGDTETVSRSDYMLQLGPGSSMSFSSMGTNPVACAMELGRNVYLQRSDFYLNSFNSWSGLCQAVRNSTKEVVGYIVLMSMNEVPYLFLRALAHSIIGNVEHDYHIHSERIKSWFIEEMFEDRLKNFSLTPREQEIAMYWMLDYDQKQIAKVLKISENTVRVFVGRINLKMHVNSKASLILKVLGAI